MEPSIVNRTIIRYVKAFASLSDDECDAPLLSMRERRLNANEIVFRQGEQGDSMMVVHHGSLSVRVRWPDGYDAEVAVARGGEVEVIKRVGEVDRSRGSDRVDVTLTPTFDRYELVDLKLLKREVHQCFGTWSGTVIGDDGRAVAIDGLRGFAEETRNRW